VELTFFASSPYGLAPQSRDRCLVSVALNKGERFEAMALARAIESDKIDISGLLLSRRVLRVPAKKKNLK
jgi:hypothetical protein